VPELLDLHGRTSKAIRAAVDGSLRRHGLNLGQDHLLAALWEEDGRTPGEIAAAAGVTTPAVTKVTARMVEAGLVTRRGDERDGRLIRLWLTEAGRALREPVEAERRLIEETIGADLTEDELAHLMSALAKVCRAATALAGGGRPEPGGSARAGAA